MKSDTHHQHDSAVDVLDTPLKSYISSVDAATDRSIVYNYNLDQALPGQKYNLLTEGMITITSVFFKGMPGIVAFRELPVRDRAEEQRRGIK